MSTYRNVLVWSGTILSVILPQIGSGGESRSSRFSLDIAPSTETEIRNGWSSLMQGGHGTIDEMIGSALAQVSLERFSEKLKIPTDTIDTHAQHPDGLTQILRMQHPDGGWKYLESDRESDIDITPYVLRSLLELRSLGQSIPDTVLDRGADALVRDLSRYRQDENILSEIAWTLALLGRTPIALELWKSIDAKNLERQGYLAYVSAGRSLGLSLPDAGKNLDMIMFSTGNTQRYGSSEDGRDAGLYVQYLIE